MVPLTISSRWPRISLIASNNLAQWLCAIVHVGGPFLVCTVLWRLLFYETGATPSKKCAKPNLRYLKIMVWTGRNTCQAGERAEFAGYLQV